MSNASLNDVVNRIFDCRMETFETVIPAYVDKVNGDKIDAIPSIKNMLWNNQIEPSKDGKLNAIMDVPVLFFGNGGCIVELELKKGDPVLLVSSSRDLSNFNAGEWNETCYDPKSFCGCDLNNMLAIPLRKQGEQPSTRIKIDNDGNVTIDCSKVKVNADLNVDGDIIATGEVGAKSGTVNLSTHTHPTSVGPTGTGTG